MVSAGTIDKNVEAESFEHFFNDVKYSTISLQRDRKQLTKVFDESIFEVDVIPMKKRLSEEYTLFLQPTYEELHIIQCAKKKTQLNLFLSMNREIMAKCINTIDELLEKLKLLEETMGVNRCEGWSQVEKLVQLGSCLNEEIKPTKYWFEQKKYDFMQELLRESQTKSEELIKAKHKLSKLWHDDVYDAKMVAALDYYMEKKEANFKLFDLTFHKCKKMLKEKFIHEDLEFTDSEIECLNDNLYCVKRNEYWLSRNQSRIGQFLGENYQGERTEFAKLRKDYEVFLQFYQSYRNIENENQLMNVLMVGEERKKLICSIKELQQLLQEPIIMKIQELLEGLQHKQSIVDMPLKKLYGLVSRLFLSMQYLEEDYNVFTHRLKKRQMVEEFQLEDMRKYLYMLDRIALKKAWFEQNAEKIQMIFKGNYHGLDTDWEMLKMGGREKEPPRERPFYEYQEATRNSYQTYLFEKGKDYEVYNEGLDLLDCISHILKLEQPIHEEILYKRMSALLNIKRMTPKIKENISAVIQTKLQEEYECIEFFYRLKAQTDIALRIPSKDEEKRDIAFISSEEIKSGILAIIKEHYELTLDDIGKILAKTLGYPRRTKKITDKLDGCIKELKRDRVIVRHSGGWQIVNTVNH